MATLPDMLRILTIATIPALALAMTTTPAYAGGRPLETTSPEPPRSPVPATPTAAARPASRSTPGLGEICYTLTVTGIATPTAAHIHRGPVDDFGGVVVHLDAPVNGTVSACEDVDRALAKEILTTPEAFYSTCTTPASVPGRCAVSSGEVRRHPTPGQLAAVGRSSARHPR